MSAPVRVPPGGWREIGPVNALIARAAGRVTGTGPPAVFTTLGRHRRLFWRWLLFAGGLMPGGRLPRADTELVILRVAHLCDCEYEAAHHRRLGRRAGLSDAEVARVGAGPEAEGWTPRQATLLRAVEELHRDHAIGDEVWAELESLLPVDQRIELCLLAGHYTMLAGALNSLGVQPER